MSTPVVSVPPDMPVKTAARVLRRRDVAAAPVLAVDGDVVGMVSELDLLCDDVLPDPRAHLRPVPVQDPPPCLVRDVMTPQVLALGPHQDLYDAVRVMREHAVRSLPVLDGGRLVGIVSRSDLLAALARSDGEIRAELTRLFGGYEPLRRVAAQVTVEDGVVQLPPGLAGTALTEASRLAATVAGVVRVHVAGSPAAGPVGAAG